MADLSILAGSTSQSIEVDLYVLATGAAQTGLVYNSTALTAAYSFAKAAPVAITLATLASNTAAFSSGGFYEKDATKQPGIYRIDIPDAALAASNGRESVISITGYSGMATRHIKIELTGWDNQDAVHGGMSALPNTACSSNASLLTSGTGTAQISNSSGQVILQTGTGTGQLDFTSGVVKSNLAQILGTVASTPATAGILDVNVKNMNNVAATAITTIKAVQGLTTADTIATYTGNTKQTADVATLITTVGVAGAGLTNIGTIATCTNLTNAPTSGDFTATMKTSIGTAVAASAVASVTAAVTVSGDFSSTMKTSLVTAAWDTVLSGHTTAGTTGAALNAAGAAGDPWTTALPGSYSAGQAGYIIGHNIDALISSRMATYTQPTGFLAATFPSGTVANTTNITAGTITTVGTLTTYTGNTPQTGDNFARIGVAGAGLTGITGVTLAAGQKVDVDTIKTNPVVNAGTATFPTNATLASTTNITGGTITTATNLTNAPTSGDLTSTMKASVTTAATAATPTVTAGTVTDKTGYSLATAPPTAAAIATAVLTTPMTEAYAATGAPMTLAEAQYQTVQQAGTMGIVGTLETVKKRDGVTTAKTFTLDSSTAPTSITETT